MRKQRKGIAEERVQKILSTARKIVEDEGLQALTMDKIAQRLDFSKGTLYNHFTSREDVMVALCTECMDAFREMFQRAALFPGRPRERFAAVGIGAEIVHALESMYSPLWITEEILSRASPGLRERYSFVYFATTEIFVGIVRDAVSQGDLPSGTDPELVAFSVWSLHEGAEELYRYRLIFRNRDRLTFLRLQREMVKRLLDGFGWMPLSREMNMASLSQRILETIFSEEVQQLGPLAEEMFPWD